MAGKCGGKDLVKSQDSEVSEQDQSVQRTSKVVLKKEASRRDPEARRLERGEESWPQHQGTGITNHKTITNSGKEGTVSNLRAEISTVPPNTTQYATQKHLSETPFLPLRSL